MLFWLIKKHILKATKSVVIFKTVIIDFKTIVELNSYLFNIYIYIAYIIYSSLSRSLAVMDFFNSMINHCIIGNIMKENVLKQIQSVTDHRIFLRIFYTYMCLYLKSIIT